MEAGRSQSVKRVTCSPGCTPRISSTIFLPVGIKSTMLLMSVLRSTGFQENSIGTQMNADKNLSLKSGIIGSDTDE
jgi:hypothetical protein